MLESGAITAEGRTAYFPHPFSPVAEMRPHAAGQTIEQILEGYPLPPGFLVRVYVGDIEIHPNQWRYTRPKPGRVVRIERYPQNGKQALTFVLLAILIIVTWGVGAGVFGGGATVLFGSGATAVTLAQVAAVGVFMAGNLAIQALIKPPTNSGEQDKARPIVQASNNRNHPFGPVPLLLGTERVYPLFAARPYTDFVAYRQWLFQALVVSSGHNRVLDIRTGDTLLSDLQSMTVQVLEGNDPTAKLDNFATSVYEESEATRIIFEYASEDIQGESPYNDVSLPTKSFDPYPVTPTQHTLVRRLKAGATGCSFIISYPEGLYHGHTDGSKTENTVRFRCYYRKVGDTNWTPFPSQVNDAARYGKLSTPFNYRRVIEDDTTGVMTVQDTVFGEVSVRRDGYIEAIDRYAAPVTRDYFFALPIQYSTDPNCLFDVAIKRFTAWEREDPGTWFSTSHLLGVRSYVPSDPIRDEDGDTFIGIKVLGTDQVNGVLETINAECTSWAMSWHGPTGGENKLATMVNETQSWIRWGGPPDVGFENGGTGGWLIAGANVTVANSSAEARTGTKSLKFTKTSIATNATFMSQTFLLYPLTVSTEYEASGLTVRHYFKNGTEYEASVWYKSSAVGKRVLLGINFQDSLASVAAQGASSSYFTITGAWQELTVRYKLTVDGPYDLIQVFTVREGSTVTAGEEFYIDDARIFPRWDWRPTENPADLFRYVLQGPHLAEPVADSRIDLTALEEWSEFCVTHGFTYGFYETGDATIRETLNDICAAGLARFNMPDGAYSVVLDVPQTIPANVITPRNSWGFQGSRKFIKVPHGLRMVFRNRAKNFQPDEHIVYNDGYGRRNATLFETIEAKGARDLDHVHKLGRYYFATAKLRPETYEVNQDMEFLRVHVGALVEVQYDVILVGLKSGRIKTITLNGSSQVTAFTTDEEVTMEGGKSYAVKIRTDDMSVSDTLLVNTVVGNTNTLTLASPISLSAIQPTVGDIFMFGPSGRESMRMVVRSIEPQEGLTARISMIAEAPRILEALTGHIPRYDPGMTPPVLTRHPLPPQAKIASLDSGEANLVRAADGTLTSRIKVRMEIGRVRPKHVAATHFEVQSRASDVGDRVDLPWHSAGTVPVSVGLIYIDDVTDGFDYDVRARCVSATGETSEWTMERHTVIGKTTRPPDPGACFFDNGAIRWQYLGAEEDGVYTIPLDLAGFEVRHLVGSSPKWNSATVLHEGLLPPSARSFTPSRAPDGVGVFLVKAVDTSGLYSLNYGFVIHDLGDRLESNEYKTVYSVSQGLLGWPGTMTNCALDASILKATVESTLSWVSDDQPFYSADANLYYADKYLDMAYSFEIAVTEDLAGSFLTLLYLQSSTRFVLEYKVDGLSAVWSGTDSASFWTSDSTLMWDTGDSWIPWPGRIELAARKYVIRFSAPGGKERVLMPAMFHTFSRKPMRESFNDIGVYIPTDGTSPTTGRVILTTTKPFREVTNVSVTLQDSGGSNPAVYARVADKRASGPYVCLYDINNNLTNDGTIDAIVEGY